MPKASIGNHFFAELTEGREADPASKGQQHSIAPEGQADGLETLRTAYEEFWDETHHPDQSTISDDHQHQEACVSVLPESHLRTDWQVLRERRSRLSKNAVLERFKTTSSKERNYRRSEKRFGLPIGFVPRLQRFGRGVLLELNIYRLANGREFIPRRPSGTLASSHLYALITIDQYVGGKRGSVYVRCDGRIFDYSVVSKNPPGDMFDTGYTIYDLERTGRYAPACGDSGETAGAGERSAKNDP